MRSTQVLKIHVVHEGGHHYYVDDLVPGRAEGTLVAGEEPGVWSGSAPPTLGLVGQVEAEPFAEVMEGRDPGSGRPLRARAGARSVAAYDLSFCAPKSVSILHLLAPRELAAEAGAGHRAAVADAAGYLERSALAVRRRSQRSGRPAPGHRRAWPEGSSTARAGRSTPTSTPTWWWPTSPKGWTASGRRSTADVSTAISRRPGDLPRPTAARAHRPSRRRLVGGATFGSRRRGRRAVRAATPLLPAFGRHGPVRVRAARRARQAPR